MQEYSFDLAAIGANAEVYRTFEPHTHRGLVLGRISIVHREQYRLYTVDGEMRAEAVGALLYRAEDASELPPIRRFISKTEPDRDTIGRRTRPDHSRQEPNSCGFYQG